MNHDERHTFDNAGACIIGAAWILAFVAVIYAIARWIL